MLLANGLQLSRWLAAEFSAYPEEADHQRARDQEARCRGEEGRKRLDSEPNGEVGGSPQDVDDEQVAGNGDR